ncbi:MAG TPA: hypothetical protein VK177_07490 [Flavobacteriales bacterium]|nr:hypothetical protein [Flavobacteriales bacterium]
MKKRIFITFGFLLIALTALTFLTNRTHTSEKEKEQKAGVNDSATVKEEIAETVTSTGPALRINDTLTDIANFIAGKKEFKTQILKDLVKDSTWIKYAGKTNQNWLKLDTNRHLAVNNWVTKQLGDISSESYNLFYPFSGPDFLNADLFFPAADTVTMFGLEPVGSLPPVEEDWFKDSLYRYLSGIKVSLNDILNLSFFKTKDMFSDLRAKELNGTTHLLLWFAARRGYSVSHVKHIALGHDGKIVWKAKGDTAYAKSAIRGIEIAVVKGDQNKIVRYFSADISNHGFKKNKRLDLFLNQYNFTNTMVKSASYLMHAANFTDIRNVILKRTVNLLQDDTGIPYRCIDDSNEWDLTLFGTYEKPINLFHMNYQDDLRKAYDSLETKPLTFGIGYKYRKDESTWMLVSKAEKKLTANNK